MRRRLVTLWPWKAAGTTLGIALFFWLYFLVQQQPWRSAWVVPSLTFDRWVGVHGWALLPYASLWLQVSLAPALMPDATRLLTMARQAGVLAAGGLVVFWLLPTTMPADPVAAQHEPWLAFLRARDGGGNAFPSLHAAFAVFSAGHIGQALREIAAPRSLRVANIAWALLICWSALATRQHVVLDVLGGVLLALAVIGIDRHCLHRVNGR